MKIKAIIFDLDDTLLVEVESATKAFMKCCKLVESKFGIEAQQFYETIRVKSKELWRTSPAREYAVAVAISSWEALWAKFEGENKEVSILRNWSSFYRNKSWELALNEFKISDKKMADKLACLFVTERNKHHVVYPDVIPILNTLKKRYKLGLITNGLSNHQRNKIRQSKLEPFFDVLVISGEYGTRKPDPEIFSVILEKLCVKPEESIMVGNSLNSDVKGGIQSRIKTIWVNRDGKKNENGIKPDFEINSLENIGEYLKKLDST